jgi:xanthosine utilization system XapX-like protein
MRGFVVVVFVGGLLVGLVVGLLKIPPPVVVVVAVGLVGSK